VAFLRPTDVSVTNVFLPGASRRPAATAQADQPLLLIVDAQLDGLRRVTQALQPFYRLAMTADPAQALLRAQALRPSLVLLGVGTPGLDGYALCQRLQSDPDTRSIPVLFVSARSTPADRVHGLSVGAVDFVPQSLDPEEVLARVRVHLRLADQIRRGGGGDEPGEEDAPTSRDPGAVLADRAVAFIREHLGEALTVGRIAQQVGTHEKRLLALFGEHVGQTVFGFLRGERLSTGLRLLTDTDMPVQEIAAHVGYANAGNFATAFRSRHGLSPQAYRQAHREGRRTDA
jgi:DNA-binding response OmpR family regulator